jgi:glycosyltransferase involved in cell wall biosynthesis
MAVNLANFLKPEVEASFLCCTRGEGMLKEELEDGIGYLFLNKKNSLDLKAFWKLRKFIKERQIDLVHAHGTSWFWAVLLKLSGLKIKLVWHDHYGNREKNNLKNLFLIYFSNYFNGVLVVSDELKNWATRKLRSRHIIKLANFIDIKNEVHLNKESVKEDFFLIVSIANLRRPKNHLNLLKAFREFSKDRSEVFLQLIGKDYNDDYSSELKTFIKNNSLNDKVEIISGTTEIMPYLYNADLAVLSSDWEALPLSILEYGLAGLPVIATNVGECENILRNHGYLVPPNDSGALEKAIREYYTIPLKRKEDGHELQLYIKNNYTSSSVLPKLIAFYNFLK